MNSSSPVVFTRRMCGIFRSSPAVTSLRSTGQGRPVGLLLDRPGNRRFRRELEKPLPGRGLKRLLARPPVEVTELSFPLIRMSENLAAAVNTRELQAF